MHLQKRALLLIQMEINSVTYWKLIALVSDPYSDWKTNYSDRLSLADEVGV